MLKAVVVVMMAMIGMATVGFEGSLREQLEADK